MNLAYGSAMASIGPTIPTIAVAMIWLSGPLELGLEPTQMILLAITVVVTMFTVQGRVYTLQGVVHLVLLAAFLGYLLGKSMIETGGSRWAWLIHWLQDVIIFSFLVMGWSH